jgi:hypothetical protein
LEEESCFGKFEGIWEILMDFVFWDGGRMEW